MLDHEGGAYAPVSGESMAIGLLQREDYRSGKGTMLVWELGAEGMHATCRPYGGKNPQDLGLLFVADADDLATLRSEGLACLASMIRRRRFDPYMLKTMAALEAAGLAEFVEDLGLNFPIH